MRALARGRRPAGRTPRPEVWKFGGAALADTAAIVKAAALVAQHPGPLAVVASALAGVTDLLLAGARRSAAGDAAAGLSAAAVFLDRHRGAVTALTARGAGRRRLLALVDRAAREYRDVCRAVAALGELSPRASDMLVARGERMSAALLAAALQRADVKAEAVDGAAVVRTDGRHGAAAADLEATRALARSRLAPLMRAGVVPVVAGYVGSGPDGAVTTLGRGGSDLTATLLGRVLAARRVILWKDVAGILTADPRAVHDARLIPQLHHREAAEVAYFGARVLHPRALIPLDGTRVTLEVRSFLDPGRAGTEVSARRTFPGLPVKAIAEDTSDLLLRGLEHGFDLVLANKKPLAASAAAHARLQAVAIDSPAGALHGTRNLVAFTSRRYRDEPLVITGPGAGPEVTAAGILNDIQQLAAT